MLDAQIVLRKLGLVEFANARLNQGLFVWGIGECFHLIANLTGNRH